MFLNFRKFSSLAARLERGLTEIEERIQKFVDTGENESRQKCEIFDQILNKEMKQICFDHNFSKSKNLAPTQIFLNSAWGVLEDVVDCRSVC